MANKRELLQLLIRGNMVIFGVSGDYYYRGNGNLSKRCFGNIQSCCPASQSPYPSVLIFEKSSWKNQV